MGMLWRWGRLQQTRIGDDDIQSRRYAVQQDLVGDALWCYAPLGGAAPRFILLASAIPFVFASTSRTNRFSADDIQFIGDTFPLAFLPDEGGYSPERVGGDNRWKMIAAAVSGVFQHPLDHVFVPVGTVL